MRLQLSLDLMNLDVALDIIEQTKESIDIIEIGTPLALLEGAKALSVVKKKYPGLDLLADYKIIDGGFYEACMAFNAGADIVTVLAVASNSTITGVIEAAMKSGKEVMVDMLGIEHIEKRMVEVDQMGVDYVCVHTAIDNQDGRNSPIEHLKLGSTLVKNSKMAVAGGVNLSNLDRVVPFRPEIVIVGSGITGSENKAQTAAAVKKHLRK